MLRARCGAHRASKAERRHQADRHPARSPVCRADMGIGFDEDLRLLPEARLPVGTQPPRPMPAGPLVADAALQGRRAVPVLSGHDQA